MSNLNALEQEEKKPEEIETVFRVLFENAPDGYFLSDLRGIFIDGNRAAEAMSGYKREELIGKNMIKVGLLKAGQISSVVARLAAHALGGKTEPGEFVLTRKDKSSFMAEINGTLVVVEGKKMVLGIVRDVTKRKEMEENLKNSEEELKAIFNSAKDGIALLDRNGRVVKVNKSLIEIGGIKEEDVVGSKIEMLTMFSPASIVKMLAAFIRTVSGEEIAPYEAEAKTKDGNDLVVEIHGSPFYRQGKIVGVVAVLRDITDRKKAEEELAETNKELEKFNKMAVGRELKIIELKDKVKELQEKLNKFGKNGG